MFAFPAGTIESWRSLLWTTREAKLLLVSIILAIMDSVSQFMGVPIVSLLQPLRASRCSSLWSWSSLWLLWQQRRWGYVWRRGGGASWLGAENISSSLESYSSRLSTEELSSSHTTHKSDEPSSFGVGMNLQTGMGPGSKEASCSFLRSCACSLWHWSSIFFSCHLSSLSQTSSKGGGW